MAGKKRGRPKRNLTREQIKEQAKEKIFKSVLEGDMETEFCITDVAALCNYTNRSFKWYESVGIIPTARYTGSEDNPGGLRRIYNIEDIYKITESLVQYYNDAIRKGSIKPHEEVIQLNKYLKTFFETKSYETQVIANQEEEEENFFNLKF